ncbi:MAG: hypothetical protein B0D87_03450, partial [Candidatus Sedimenticola endophacoides]
MMAILPQPKTTEPEMMRPGGYVALFFLLLLIAWPCIAPGAVSAPATDEPHLTIAYRSDTWPYQFTNQQGEPDGLIVDMWRLWAEKSSTPVRFVAGDEQATYAMLHDGRADLLASAWTGMDTARHFEHGAPLVEFEHYLYADAGLPGLASLRDALPYRIGVTRGSYLEYWLHANAPGAAVAVYRDYRTLLGAVERGEVKLFLAQEDHLRQYAVAADRSLT